VEPFDEAMRYPTVFEFGEEYIMIHSVERLGKIDKQGANRATLIQGTAPLHAHSVYPTFPPRVWLQCFDRVGWT